MAKSLICDLQLVLINMLPYITYLFFFLSCQCAKLLSRNFQILKRKGRKKVHTCEQKISCCFHVPSPAKKAKMFKANCELLLNLFELFTPAYGFAFIFLCLHILYIYIFFLLLFFILGSKNRISEAGATAAGQNKNIYVYRCVQRKMR